MNIWSCNKHKSIKLLLFKVVKQFGDEHVCIESRDNKDYFSVALIKPDQPEVSAYIYTYGQTRDEYGLHIEYPWFGEDGLNDTLYAYDGLNINQVINTLATHFEIEGYGVAV